MGGKAKLGLALATERPIRHQDRRIAQCILRDIERGGLQGKFKTTHLNKLFQLWALNLQNWV